MGEPDDGAQNVARMGVAGVVARVIAVVIRNTRRETAPGARLFSPCNLVT